MCLITFLSVSCGDCGAEIDYVGDEKDEELPTGTVSIAYLKSLYTGHNMLIDRELYVVGRVISSDQNGAFYKNVIIQDNTGGIVLRVDYGNYYRKFPVGTEINVACNSLTISDYGGQLQLGYGNGYLTNSILATSLTTTETEMERPVPQDLEIEEISAKYISCFVRIEDVQFEEMGAAWCDPASESGTNRYLIDRHGNRLIVRTNPSTAFANELLPTGSGFVDGILGVFNNEYQLQVLSEKSLFMKGERF